MFIMFIMFKSIFNLILLFTKTSDNKIIHYRIIKVNGEQACIEANISKKTAKKFNATAGNCNDMGCYIYKGNKYIPFCCELTGYACSHASLSV